MEKFLLTVFIITMFIAAIAQYSKNSNNKSFEDFVEISNSNYENSKNSNINLNHRIVQTDIDSSRSIYEVKSCVISFLVSPKFEDMKFDCVENKKKDQIIDRNCNSVLAWTPHPNELNRDNCLIIKSKSENPNQVYRVEADIHYCTKGTDRCGSYGRFTCCKFLGPMSQEDLKILKSLKEQ